MMNFIKKKETRDGFVPGLNKRHKLYNVSIDEIKRHFNEAINLRDFLKRLGYESSGSSSDISVLLSKIGLNKDDLVKRGDSLPNRWRKPRQEKWSISEIFCKDSKVSTTTIKEYVRRHKLIEYKCSICGNTGTWMGKPLGLQLHHINGCNNDNRLENLTYVCPNCHSQTDTFTSRNYETKNVCSYCGRVIQNKTPGAMCVTCRRINSKQKIRVRCVETGEIFNSLKDVGDKYKTSPSSVGKCLKGTRATALGYHWEKIDE